MTDHQGNEYTPDQQPEQIYELEATAPSCHHRMGAGRC